jgi:hypothetical protein
MLRLRFFVIAALAPLLLVAPAPAQLDFEREPINYHAAPVNDPVAKLQAALDAGETKLEYDEERGYLPAVLKALDVRPSSQMLVFSKTSFQLRKITPQRPRAVYFRDDMYIGYVQRGDVLELSAVDPQQGAVFYTLSQEKTETPRFVRDRGQCIACHASSRTQGVPGHLVRSVFADRSGQPQLGSGTFTIDHRSPFDERWGGWYVSGTHGAMRHMGNVTAEDRDRPENIDRERGANVSDLKPLVNVEPYLEPTSDVVALMVLEHQTQMHNHLTFANYEARSAAHYDEIMNAAFERPADYQSETTQRRIAAAGEKVLQYMLFSEEFKLTSPVKGVSSFTEEFPATGPRDQQGRSLRDFDLERRLFKYPCSYLIDSPSFDGLPSPMKSYIARRLHEVLTGEDQTPPFAHLTPKDRQNILEILQATKPDLWDEP